jgi:hypothetical protein
MCEFFSFVTEPENNGGKRFYFDWDYRKTNLNAHLDDEVADSHSIICKHFGLKEDACNKYEFNPLTKEFVVDQINATVDDRVQVEEWVNNLDFKKVVEPLIVKPIVNPLKLKMVKKPTKAQIKLLEEWDSVGASVTDSVWDSVWDSVGASVTDSVRASVGASVWDSVGASVGASVRASVGASIWDSVGASVRASVWASVRASVGASVWAYTSSFFDIKHKQDFSSCIKLWEQGFVPSFDGKTWRLHSGKKAAIVYEWTK